MSLEDHCGDVISKARRSAGATVDQAARAAGLSPRDYETLEETGNVSGSVDFEAVGAFLGLSGSKLGGIALGWAPAPIDLGLWNGLKMITTEGANFSVNAFLVWDDKTREAALFDTGFDAAPMFEAIDTLQLTPRHLFITHSHHDHIEALAPIRQRFPAIQLHSDSKAAPQEQRNQRGVPIVLGGLSIENRATPGHAEDGVTYVIRGFPGDRLPVAVVGDAIFAGSIGGAREFADLARTAIRKEIFSLPGGTVICPGHGPVTTVAEELAHNPFFV